MTLVIETEEEEEEKEEGLVEMRHSFKHSL